MKYERTEKNGVKVKRHIADGGEMVRMVGITAGGTAVLTDKQKRRIIVRDRVHGGGLDLSEVLS